MTYPRALQQWVSLRTIERRLEYDVRRTCQREEAASADLGGKAGALAHPNDRRVGSLFERLQIGDQVSNLTYLEPKLRHGRMRGHDTLGERLGEILDRIA